MAESPSVGKKCPSNKPIGNAILENDWKFGTFTSATAREEAAQGR